MSEKRQPTKDDRLFRQACSKLIIQVDCTLKFQESFIHWADSIEWDCPCQKKEQENEA